MRLSLLASAAPLALAACSASAPPSPALVPPYDAFSAIGGPAPPSEPRRPKVVSVPIRVAKLPLAEAEPADPDELVVEPSTSRTLGSNERWVRLLLADRGFALIELPGRVGWQGGPFTGRERGAFTRCGVSDAPLEATRWTTLRQEAGGVVVSSSIGWFDPQRCTVVAAGRSTARPVALAPTAGVYAFRRCDDGCPSGEDLVLLLPATSSFTTEGLRAMDVRSGAFSVVTVPLRPGMARSFMARVYDFDVAGFQSGLGAARGERPAANAMVIDLEVVQTSADDEPVAVLHVSQDPADGSAFDPTSDAFSPQRSPSLSAVPFRDDRPRPRRRR